MLTPIHFATKRGALQGSSPKVESKRYEGIKLAIGQRHIDQPKDTPLGLAHILLQQILGFLFADPVRKPISLTLPHHMAVADGWITRWADVDSWGETLKPLPRPAQTEPEAHGGGKRHLDSGPRYGVRPGPQCTLPPGSIDPGSDWLTMHPRIVGKFAEPSFANGIQALLSRTNYAFL